jgi:isopentenyl-diphosphate delta-isomerase
MRETHERVILVDENDREIGSEEKLKTHQQGLLHRAFSIFVLNSKGELLLQKRAAGKYHSPGLWGNTCCSHPRPGEDLEDAVHRRLQAEMGFDCLLQKDFSFLYRVELNNGLIEHEVDHVFSGRHDGDPKANPEEVQDWLWVDLQTLRHQIAARPQDYAYWLKEALNHPAWKY